MERLKLGDYVRITSKNSILGGSLTTSTYPGRSTSRWSNDGERLYDDGWVGEVISIDYAKSYEFNNVVYPLVTVDFDGKHHLSLYELGFELSE